ncbi:MAG TPA: UDP-N-acetylmuramate--L-alanine ligase [Planctomycetaceae bacterium]|nr:UDP-N-acetylmuramate--L-alanine ligase [Planctomycetaceae bacterium]
MVIAGSVPRIARPEVARLHPLSASPQAGIAHLIGVCGSGMKALAEVLAGQGWIVTGSDLRASDATIAAFSRRGLRIHSGHQSGFVPGNADVIVYSPAIHRENPERQLAERLGIPQLSYSQMLGRLMQNKIGVCIAGTHGKSTTTAMTGCVLTAAELAPTVVVGAELCGWRANGWSGEGRHFVVESCEYQRSFLDLTPHSAVILGIEPDHFDCYAHFDETIAAFAAFAQRVPAEGALLIPAGSEGARAACIAAVAPVETFGLVPEADWWAGDIRPVAAGTRYRAYYQGEYVTEIALRIPGRHNVLNSLAAVALAYRAGAPADVIREALAEFPGIKRRFETVGSWRGATLIDDYAHHPTAVAVTLAAARERFPRRKLWCVFQPHQVSRTTALLGDFAATLARADEVLVVPVFAARENVEQEPETVSRELASRAVDAGGRARFVAGLDHAVATLDDELQPGDVLITMGAGDIGQVHHAFTRRLQRHHAS